MAKPVPPRSLTPLLAFIRDFLLGRKYTNSLRFQDTQSSRSPPPPHLPGGPSHKLAANYYLDRDGRRESLPPVVVKDIQQAIVSGTEKSTASLSVMPKPGNGYIWKEAPKS